MRLYHVKIRPFLLVLIGLLGMPATAASQKHGSRPRAYAVFDAVLDSLYHSNGERPDLVVVADSLFWREGAIVYQGKFFPPHRSVIGTSTIDSFEKVTSRSTPFPSGYRYKGNFRVLGADEYWRLLARGNAIAAGIPAGEQKEMPYWMAFTERYPKAWGVTVLTDVGFNTDSTEALIQVRHQCGGGCYSSEVILLDRVAGKWKFVERMDVGSSDMLGSGSMRYLGPNARTLANVRRTQDSTRRAVADSIRRDRAPRRIHGTAYNAITGKPLPGVPVLLDIRTPLDDSARVVRVITDSRGRYQFRDPPLGGRMIVLQCAGSVDINRGVLDAPAFYVHPQIDTTIDLYAPNIEPCWRSPRRHKIESGEIAGLERAQPPHPTAAELEIYQAVIHGARVDSTTFLVEAETAPWCDWKYDCPKLSIAHLIRNHEVDSTTLSSFRLVGQDTVPLNPWPMRAIGARLFSKGERAYLLQESSRLSELGPDTRTTPWSLLREVYDADAVLTFTRVGFNVRGDEAIVAYRLKAALDRERETLLLKRLNGRWTITRRHLDTERPSADMVNGSCVPATRGAKPSKEEMQSIIGDYDFTLISSAVDNRTIPWRMKFLRDSTGAIVFEVLDPKSGERKASLEPGTHFGGGDIGFRNAAQLLQFDGFGYAFTVDRVQGDLLFGVWEHYSFGTAIDNKGRPIPEPAGHFCAVRGKVSQ
jgi:hypothetical protein